MEEKAHQEHHDANGRQVSHELGVKAVGLHTPATEPSAIDAAAQTNVPWVTARIDRVVKGMKSDTARQQARLIVRSLRAVYGDKQVLVSQVAGAVRDPENGTQATQDASARGDIGDKNASPAFRAAQAAKAVRALKAEIALAAMPCSDCGALNPADTGRCLCGHILQVPKERGDGDQGRSMGVFR